MAVQSRVRWYFMKKPSQKNTRNELNDIDVRTLTTSEVYILFYDYIIKTSTKIARKHYIEPEDLSQEVFTKIPNAHKKYQGEALFTTYLYKIIFNTCMDMLRKNKRQERKEIPFCDNDISKNNNRFSHDSSVIHYREYSRQISDIPDYTKDPQNSHGLSPEIDDAIRAIMKGYHHEVNPDTTVVTAEGTQIIEAGLTELKNETKVAIGKLYFIEGATQNVIADQLECAQSTVSEHINNLRRHLLDYIQRNYPETNELIKKIKRLMVDV